jgi:hypothetical protein
MNFYTNGYKHIHIYVYIYIYMNKSVCQILNLSLHCPDYWNEHTLMYYVEIDLQMHFNMYIDVHIDI